MGKNKANGIIINYEDKGTLDNFILIHGMGDNNKMWWNQVPTFSKYTRMYMIDVRGHGSSDRPKEGYSTDNMVEDVRQWFPLAQAQVANEIENTSDVVYLAARPIMLGYSMGGRIALEYAVRNPKDVRALILVSSGVGLPRPAASPEAQKRRDDMMALLKKGDIKKWAEMMTESAFSPGFRQKNSKVFDQYMKIKMEQKADAMLNLMQGMATPSATQLDLTRLTMPVMIVVGQNDPNNGAEQGKAAQAAIPNSKLVVLPTGHASPIEAPDQFNAAVLPFVREVIAKVPSGKL